MGVWGEVRMVVERSAKNENLWRLFAAIFRANLPISRHAK